MTDSKAGEVNLRIRFAGLNLFVPDIGEKYVHVLMPRTGAGGKGQVKHVEHEEHSMPAHLLLIHWVSGGLEAQESLVGKHLVLQHNGWPAVTPQIPGVFRLENLARAAGCSTHDHGKVDVAAARPAATLELHSGHGRVINPGGEWTINGKRHPMPTVMDWWVPKIDRAELMSVLQRWGVFGTKMPDVSSKNNVDLWILHAPYTEQHPESIGSAPILKGTSAHFHAYLPLLKCKGHKDNPEQPVPQADPGDRDPPHHPRQGIHQGMFLNCMLAQAAMTGSTSAA